ncbi:MAG: hypothetical protein U5M23_03150 [Marinagarivorans sp.]|nr:hypothetical protein [Marinagarivorans sp.]
MTTLEADFLTETRHAKEALHQAGFVTQQVLCAYLLDVGFADAWNAIHIKQDIAKGLAYANACGFGHDCPDMARLAAVLSPYWKWGYHYHDWEGDRPRTGGFMPATITPLVRYLPWIAVHDVTEPSAPERVAQRRPQGRRGHQCCARDADHLPAPIDPDELLHVTTILFEAFEETTKGRCSEHFVGRAASSP